MTSLFILAGEASGDRIGADLIHGIKQVRPDVGFFGVGGEAMGAEGLDNLFDMDDLAVMGYRDVILRLPLLLWRARQVVREILKSKPDAVVLIDSQVFSKVVAKRLRRAGYGGKIILYVAPAVWAWGAQRARKLADIYDEVLSVLPFEPSAMESLGGPKTVYVGHPAISRLRPRPDMVERGPLLLLPGSRRGEINRHMPLFEMVAKKLLAHSAIDGFSIISTRAQAEHIRRLVARWAVPVSVLETTKERQNALGTAVAAIAVSGTVTLELALAKVPHILTYIAEAAQVRIFKNATTPYIGLPNIIASAPVVPEVLFDRHGDAEALGSAITRLLDDRTQRTQQVRQFDAIRTLMEKGAPEAPLSDPVERVLAYLQQA